MGGGPRAGSCAAVLGIARRHGLAARRRYCRAAHSIRHLSAVTTPSAQPRDTHRQTAALSAAAAAAGVGAALWSADAAAAEREDDVVDDALADDFSSLAKQHGVMLGPGVRLRVGPNGRGLFTSSPVSDGELLIRVPWSACLYVNDSAEARAESAGAGWPFWMAITLLRAASPLAGSKTLDDDGTSSQRSNLLQ